MRHTINWRTKHESATKRTIFCYRHVAWVMLFALFFASLLCSLYINRKFHIKSKAIFQANQLAKLPFLLEKKREQMQCFFNQSNYSREAYIAHGSGINEYVYTNSTQGVMDSISKGFRYIEIDFRTSRDGFLVGVHEWVDFEKYTSLPSRTASLLTCEELKKLKIKNKFTIITAKDLRHIMHNNPDIILVTDKTDNFRKLIQELPFHERIIVEVFSTNAYQNALSLGIKYPAFSVWNEKTLETAEQYKFPIIVADARMVCNDKYTERFRTLHQKRITILAYNSKYCDTDDFIYTHLGKTVSKIYTDCRAPHCLQQLTP